MGKRSMMRMLVTIAVAAISVSAAAQQTQNASQPNQNQTQNQNQAQPQNQTQTQPQQPTQQQPAQPQKKSFWQKVKDAQNAMQQSAQQGQSTVQQGTNGVQQTMQNGAQGVQNGMQGAQQTMQGVSGPASGAFSGGGGGAGVCGTSCFDAGAFQANVAQMTMSQEGGWHIIRMNIQFHNATNQPLAIGYHDGSMVMVDNNGATYAPAGGSPGELQGMGIDRGAQTDSQFVLGPGQTGSALFSVARWRAATSPVGTGYSYNLTIDELQPQNGAMALVARTYNLNFPSLTPGTSNASFSARPAMTQSATSTAPATTTTPASVVNNAAMKTPVTKNATQRPVVVVVKPIPTTTPANAAQKKTTTTTTTSTSPATPAPK